MLQIIREKAQGWIAWVLIIALGIAFTFIGTGWLFNRGEPQKVATVNGEIISWQQFAQRFDQLKQQNPEIADANPTSIKQGLLDDLIRQLAVKQASAKAGFTVSETQVNELVKSIPVLQENNQFSYERLLQLLHQLHLTQSEFFNQVSDMMIVAQLEDGLRDSAFILDTDLEKHIQYLNQKRQVQYTVVDKTAFEKSLNISDAAVEAYYQSHQTKYMTEPAVQLEYIHLDFDEMAKTITVSDTEISEYYEAQQSLFVTPEQIKVAHILVAAKPDDEDEQTRGREQAERLRARIIAGEDFAALAKVHSADTGSAAQGGMLDWIKKGQTVPTFEAAAFALTSDTPLSAVIPSPYGFHIIQLHDHKAPQVESLASVRAQIEAELLQNKTEAQQIALADEMVMLAYEHPDSLDRIVDKLSLTSQVSDFMTQESMQGIFADPAVKQAAFSSEVLEEQLNSDLIKIGHDYLVIRLKSFRPSSQQPFNEVKAAIHAQLADEYLMKQSSEKAKEILAALATGKTPQAVGQSFQLDWTSALWTRAEMAIDHRLLSKAFALAQPDDDTVTAGVTQTDNGYAVIVLDQVIQGAIAELPTDRIGMIKQFLARNVGQTDFELYASHALTKSKVERHLIVDSPDSDETI